MVDTYKQKDKSMFKFLLIFLFAAISVRQSNAAILYIDVDGDTSNPNFNITPNANINVQEIYDRVVKSYNFPLVIGEDGTLYTAPALNVNVTLIDPQHRDKGVATSVVVGNPPFPMEVGGFAHVNGFFDENAINIAYVFPELVGMIPLNVAKAIEHEANHLFGLFHPQEGYIHGRIMGYPYSEDAAYTLAEYNLLANRLGVKYIPEPNCCFILLLFSFAKRKRRVLS